MSGHAAPVLPYPQGIARIFQQSVKNLDHPDTHSDSKTDRMKGDEREKHAPHYRERFRNRFNRNKCGDNVPVIKKTTSETREIKKPNENDAKDPVPCLFSLPLKERPPRSVCRQADKRTSKKTKFRGKEPETEIVTDQIVAPWVINHFNENWTLDDEVLPDHGPLQSTPKKGSKDVARNYDKLVGSGKNEAVRVNRNDFQDSDKFNISDENSNNNFCEVEKNCLSLKDINIDRKDIDTSKTITTDYLKKGFKHEQNLDKVEKPTEKQAECVTTSTTDTLNSFRSDFDKVTGEMHSNVDKSANEIDEDSKQSQLEGIQVKMKLKGDNNEKNIDKINVKIGELSEGKHFQMKQNGSREIAKVVPAKGHVSKKIVGHTSHEENEPRKMTSKVSPDHWKEKRSYGRNYGSSYYKKSPSRTDLPPRFLNQNNQHRESFQEREYSDTHRYNGKFKRHLSFPERKTKLRDLPVYFNHPKINSKPVRLEPTVDCDIPRKGFGVNKLKFQMTGVKKTRNDSKENTTDAWIMPCSEDWTTDLLTNEEEQGGQRVCKSNSDNPSQNIKNIKHSNKEEIEKTLKIIADQNQDLCIKLPTLPTNGVLCEIKENQDSASVEKEYKRHDKCDVIDDQMSVKFSENRTSDIPYLPPSPPVSECDFILDVSDDNVDLPKDEVKTNLINPIKCKKVVEESVTGETFVNPCEVEVKVISEPALNSLDGIKDGCVVYEADQRIANGIRDNDRAIRNPLNEDYCGSGTSEADVSELQSDEIVSIYSGNSRNQSAAETPIIVNSQESTLNIGARLDLDSTAVCTTDHSKGNMQTLNMPYDYSDWTNAQYDDSYWQWYYHMYVESYKHMMMNWQRKQFGQKLTDNQRMSQSAKLGGNSTVKHDRSTDKGECETHQVRPMETLDESLHSDYVAERTTNWVKCHGQGHVTSGLKLQAERESVSDNTDSELPAEVSGKVSKTGKLKNSETTRGKQDVNGNLKESFVDRTETTVNNNNVGVDGGNDGEGCMCSEGEVQYMVWRVCGCGPPRLQSVNPTVERNTDLGYQSWESKLDHEDATFQRKNEQQSRSSYHHSLRKPGCFDSDWKDRALKCGSPYLYDQIAGFKPPPAYQQVYMMHSANPYVPGSSTSGSRPETSPSLDNAPVHPSHTRLIEEETDENGNKIQQGTSGKLKMLVDEINKSGVGHSQPHDSASLHLQGHPRSFSPHYGPRPAFPFPQNRGDHIQQMSNPLTQSEAHLSEVQKTLTYAEKTNSRIGKSFCVMKDAISAIQQYTDPNVRPFNNSNVSQETVAASVSCDTQTTDSKIDKGNIKHADLENSDERNGNNTRPGFNSYFAKGRRDRFEYGSSSDCFTGSSDDICRDSMLSQSPDTRRSGQYCFGGRGYGRNQFECRPGGKGRGYNPHRVFQRQSYSARGIGPRLLSSDRQRSVVPHDYNGNTNQTDLHRNLFNTQHSEHYTKSYEPSQNYPVPLYDKPPPPLPNKMTLQTDKETPRKQFPIVGTETTPKSVKMKNSKLVDYVNSDDSQSEEERENFDVDSLSSEFTPVTVDEGYSPVQQSWPKKLKHETSSHEESTSPYSNRFEKTEKTPVGFMKRPQRKLAQKQLKNLPFDDLPNVSFVKRQKTPTKSPQPKTITEMISREKAEHAAEDNKPLEMPPLPPLPPFPQSQFWSMYLPKYNSALTGKQEAATPPAPKPVEKRVSMSPVTPEWNRPMTRRSWGAAGCAMASLSDTDSENRTPKSDWKSTFRRFHSFGVKYIDTHCHLDFLFKRDDFNGNLRDYMNKHPETFPDTFEGCVAVFCNPATFTPNGGLWREVAKEDNVWIAMGCHPKMATDFTENAESGLRQCLKHNKCVALGEIGLDYSGSFQQHEEVQKKVFKKQLVMAVQINMPLVIHCRDAEQDCLEILKEMVPRDYKIHCHCFTAYYYNAKLWMDAFPNLYIGVTPLVTYRTAKPCHDLARNIPLNRLLLETDAPYFIPRGIPKEELSLSNPGFAVTVAKEIAQYQELPVAAVLRQTRLNTKFMYGI